MKAIEHYYFHVVLLVVLYKVVLTFKSVNEILVCDHSNRKLLNWAIRSYGTVYHVLKLCRVGLDRILVWGHSDEDKWSVLSCDIILLYKMVPAINFGSNTSVWAFRRKLLSRAFHVGLTLTCDPIVLTERLTPTNIRNFERRAQMTSRTFSPRCDSDKQTISELLYESDVWNNEHFSAILRK